MCFSWTFCLNLVWGFTKTLGFFAWSLESVEWELMRFMLVSTWLFKFLGTWIWGTRYDMFNIWISTLWFMEKIWVWGNIKLRAVQIQISAEPVNVDRRFGFNWCIANTNSIIMQCICFKHLLYLKLILNYDLGSYCLCFF